GSAFQRLRLAPGEDVPAALAALRADPAVAAADPNYLNYRFYTPTDPQFANQWGLPRIDAPAAWDITKGATVVIAIIDDGLHLPHPDISGNLEVTSGYSPSGTNGYDFAVGDVNPEPGSQTPPCTWLDVSHGTHVAGLAAAVENNGVGGVGVAFDATVLSLKVFPDACDSGASDADIIEAINYAGANGVDVANLSLGRNGPISESMRLALADAIANGTLFVVAAGNAGENNDLIPVWPANYAKEPGTEGGVISVAASDPADQRAYFSNFGPTTVTLAAPGVNMLSTVRNNDGSYGYTYFTGTSMAAPMVAGVAALLKAAEPSLTPAQIKARLVATGDAAPGAGCYTASGKRVNAYNALTNSTTPTPCAVLSVLASEGSSVCLITHLTQGVLPREALEPLRDLREFLWQRGGWGRALVRAYYRGSTAIIGALRAARARQALAAAHGSTGTI
ncbi:MAG TPA: S8 family peptidase, partial [bacterium]